MALPVCVAMLVATARDYHVAVQLFDKISTFATSNVRHYMYSAPHLPASAFSNVFTAQPFPVKLDNSAKNWQIAHERLNLFNHTIGQCEWVVSLDIDVVIVRPFPELLAPAPTMYVTYGMDLHTYPYGVNGGVFAFRPNIRIYNEIAQRARACPTCNDQTVINKLETPKTVLSYIYNMSPALCGSSAFGKTQYKYVKIWHFTYMSKPWKLSHMPSCVRPLGQLQ